VCSPSRVCVAKDNGSGGGTASSGGGVASSGGGFASTGGGSASSGAGGGAPSTGGGAGGAATTNIPDAGTGIVSTGMRRVFVSSSAYNGNLKATAGTADGVTGGDKLCQGLADAMMLGGAWMSLLASDGSDGADRFMAPGPWVLLNGTMAFPNKAALTSTSADVAININEQGQMTNGPVWSGLENTPLLWGNCSDWSSASGSNTGVAGTSALPNRWTLNGMPACGSPAHLYCFEQ
jgi:hypothetical protein